MDSRKRIILRAVVEDYIEHAEPVGSKTLRDKTGLEVSPATLRNEMALLEEMGMLEHPHTSAGRVPTAAGYRMYVDELMRRYRLSVQEMEDINRTMRLKMQELDRMLMEAGRLVSQLTGQVSFAVTPQIPRLRILRLEAFLTDPQSLVLVLAAEGGLVKTKWVRLSAPARAEEIARLTAAVNAVYAGQEQRTDDMARRCRELCAGAAVYLDYVLELIRELGTQPQEVYLSGETHLLDHPEFQDLLRARKTLEYLSEQRRALPGLSRAEAAVKNGKTGGNVEIIIGPENVARELSDTSVVMAGYRLGGGMRGVIGIIGPTRMDYARLKSRLGYVAGKLEELFNNSE